MNKKIKVSGGIITLTDKSYVASGGEGAIYASNNFAYKLYHDPVKKMLPLKKIQELSVIVNPQVIIPKDIIYDPADGSPIGYTTTFVNDTNPLIKLFTKTFKDDNNISHQMICNLVKEMQLITSDIHNTNCLIVDYNELNVLVKIDGGNLVPYYIDTDSYCTPSFKATAVMDSIRDRKVSIVDKNGVLHYNPTIESDWFSFAILAFNLYTNIHAFRGSHKNYKPNEKKKQMDDGISVFHTGVRTPPCVTDFRLIPSRHLGWFKDVFLNNNRSIPPLPDSSAPLMVPTQIITIQGTDKLGVKEINAYADDILAVFPIMGVYYVATKKHIYANKKEIGTHTSKKVLLCASTDGTVVTAQQDISDKIFFKSLTQPDPIGTAQSKNMFARNNAIYTISRSGKLIENSFTAFGAKTIHRINEIENVSVNSATMYEGCVIQDLLGKMFLTFPYKLGSCFSKHIPQLDGYRIINAKADKNIVIVVGEKNGVYDRFILIFSKQFSNIDVRKVDDIAYDTINFCVLDNGLCALLASADELELFSTAYQCETLNNPPIDSTMKLLATADGIFFINGNSLHQLKKH